MRLHEHIPVKRMLNISLPLLLKVNSCLNVTVNITAESISAKLVVDVTILITVFDDEVLPFDHWH